MWWRTSTTSPTPAPTSPCSTSTDSSRTPSGSAASSTPPSRSTEMRNGHLATAVNQILQELSREWPGSSYELLSRNCNHFSNTFCDKLGCPKLPGRINRFANAGDAALEVAETTSVKLKQAKKEIVTACKAASTFLTGTSSSAPSNVEDTVSSGNTSFFEGTWVKSVISISMKPSKSLVSLDGRDDEKSGDESESESDDDEPNSDQDYNQQDATPGAQGHKK